MCLCCYRLKAPKYRGVPYPFASAISRRIASSLSSSLPQKPSVYYADSLGRPRSQFIRPSAPGTIYPLATAGVASTRTMEFQLLLTVGCFCFCYFSRQHTTRHSLLSLLYLPKYLHAGNAAARHASWRSQPNAHSQDMHNIRQYTARIAPKRSNTHEPGKIRKNAPHFVGINRARV